MSGVGGGFTALAGGGGEVGVEGRWQHCANTAPVSPSSPARPGRGESGPQRSGHRRRPRGRAAAPQRPRPPARRRRGGAPRRARRPGRGRPRGAGGDATPPGVPAAPPPGGGSRRPGRGAGHGHRAGAVGELVRRAGRELLARHNQGGTLVAIGALRSVFHSSNRSTRSVLPESTADCASHGWGVNEKQRATSSRVKE